MELLNTDDQTQALLLTTDTQDLSGDSQGPSEKLTSEIPPENVSGDSKNNTKLLEQTTQMDKISSAFNMSEDFACISQTATKDLSVWDFSNSPEPIVSLGGLFTCNTTDVVAPPSAIMAEEEHISASQPLADLLSTTETLPEPHICESLFKVSLKSDDCNAAALLRSLSHRSDSSESDTPVAPLSDLYIFESETQDFILSPHLDAQEIKCPECLPLSLITVADVQSEAHKAVGDSFEVVTKYDRDLLKDVAHHDSDKDVGPPALNACDVTQEKAEVTVQTQRNDSPVELWLDACQYLVDSEDRNERLQSVMQDTLSSTTSDFSVPPEETQRSGYSPSACDVIGWCFDDNKSWGPPVERWSSVDSWASALSDWAEIISTPPEDLTAAFTEIGAEIDALTQALAEVTTQIETEQQSKPIDALEQSPMGIQYKPLESQNITESSIFSGQSCLTCCLRPEDQRTEGITQLCTTEMELELLHSCQPEAQQQLMGSFEVTSSEKYSEDTTVLSVIPGAAFEVVTDLVDFKYFSVKTDTGNEVVLAIVEDTDLEEKRAPEGLLNYEPSSKHKREVKDEHVVSSRDLSAERDSDRSCTPPDTLKVDRQKTEVLPDLQLLNTLTPADLHVPRVDSGLNVHVLPNTLADLDRACQVEPLWGSPKFIIPLAPLSIGSSLVTQASSSSNGDQEVAKWAPSDNRDSVYDHTQAYDLWPDSDGITDFSSGSNEDISQPEQSQTDSTTDLKTEEITECYCTESKTIFEESKDLLNLAAIPIDHFTISEEKQVACFTLDLYDPFTPLALKPRAKAMPHKTHKSSSEGKTRSKKDRPACPSHGVHTSKKQENIPYNAVVEQSCTLKEKQAKGQDAGLEHKDSEKVIEIGVVPQKGLSRHHSKKKKKHTGKSTAEPPAEVENEAKNDKARTDVLKDKADTKGNDQSATLHKKTDKPEAKVSPKDKQLLNTGSPNDDDDIIKKRRLSQDKFGKLVSSLESKFSKTDTSKGAEDKEEAGSTRRKAYSEVVKQKTTIPKSKQDLPKVVQPIQAVCVSGDPQSLCLWCQFSDVVSDHTVTWRRDRAVLAEIKRSAGDESRISLTISNASQKDLGKYQCQLCSVQGTVTLDYLLTYELLSEIVIPTTPKTIPTAPVEVGHEEESVNCSRLMFKVDFLTEQYFGDSQSASIVTEKIHFGEGMHRRAFRTKLQAGQIPLIVPGHHCVLKVHNAISYGTKNNEELVQKNFNLAVEECQVQNTAREYIKAYTEVAQSFDAFGQVPEIIPIYLVHRPSNDIPYATLEEELIGDFVKYSVKDGKEINLMRKDSEAGQKCCAFQHWVYHNTEGNLLVTDMQGVGMRLTDVGIATCKKGYKGFKGNCATSFIDQFKALHQCNSYCEILGLTSLQPKPKKTTTPKSKGQSGAIPKKKTFEPTAKGKS